MSGRAIRYLELPTYDQGTIFSPGSEPKQSIFEESATQKHRLGARFIDGDRTFRYAHCGSAAGITKAYMAQTELSTGGTLELASFWTIPQTANFLWSVGDISGTVLVTTGETPVLNNFTDGYLFFNKVQAIGDSYRILASKIDPDDDTILNLELETPIRTAITGTTTEMVCQPNKFWGTVVFPTTATGIATGVPLITVTADYFYWAQTQGPCPVIVDDSETVVLGASVGLPDTAGAAGKCGVRLTLEEVWGNVMAVGAAEEPALIDLKLE